MSQDVLIETDAPPSFIVAQLGDQPFADHDDH